MNRLIYKDQNVEELEYNLILSDQLNLDLNILDNKVTFWNNMKFEFSIIGSSHQIKVDISDDQQLLELLSCIKLRDRSIKPLIQKGLFHQQSLKYKRRINNNLTYNFKLEVLSYTTSKEIKQDKNNYLYYSFPSDAGDAITSIEYWIKEKEIKWVTYHSYPNQDKLVRTSSILEK